MALMEVPPEEISAYGVRPASSQGGDDGSPRRRHGREARGRRGAVEPGGRSAATCSGPTIFDALDNDPARRRAARSSSPTPSPCSLAGRAVYGVRARPRAATTSARRATTCAPSSSSRSTATTSVPTSEPSWTSSCARREIGPHDPAWPRHGRTSWCLDRCRPARRCGTSHCDDLLGAVLAVGVRANEPVPPFANTAMDGFAVRAADMADAPVSPADRRHGRAAGDDPPWRWGQARRSAS